jgi:hypothetical protein
MPRKPKNYGQLPLSSVESQIEADIEKENRPLGMPPRDLIKDYAAQLGLTESDAEQIYDAWLANGFRLKTGLKVRDFKAAMRTWKREGFFMSQKKAAAATKEMEDREVRRKLAIRRMKEK